MVIYAIPPPEQMGHTPYLRHLQAHEPRMLTVPFASQVQARSGTEVPENMSTPDSCVKHDCFVSDFIVRPQDQRAVIYPAGHCVHFSLKKSSCKGLIDKIAAVSAGQAWQALSREFNSACPGIAYECVEYVSNPQNNQCNWIERKDGNVLNRNRYP